MSHNHALNHNHRLCFYNFPFLSETVKIKHIPKNIVIITLRMVLKHCKNKPEFLLTRGLISMGFFVKAKVQI
ncbi:hypothetical protein KKP91_04485 [Methanothermococcus sp. SCGC AD-155-M21]|nr:hypothetical protein [Methanothermococcus sp. SCGC AD-155-M21]